MSRPKDPEEKFEPFRRRQPKHSARRALADLTPSAATAALIEARTGEAAPEFLDRDLQELHDRGIVRRIVRQLKSGKEATVYICDGSQGRVAAKLYHDIHTRTFRNDALYSAGRYVGDLRTRRAIANGSKAGLAARLALWIEHEFGELSLLFAAGVPVPRPLAHAGNVIVMEFIGEGEVPAPRLSDIRLSPRDAREAFRQSIEALASIVARGRVHGDFSTFNLLWWRQQVFVIDLPQLIVIDEHGFAVDFLRRDIESLCTTFARLNVDADPRDVARQVIRLEGTSLLHSPLRSLIE